MGRTEPRTPGLRPQAGEAVLARRHLEALARAGDILQGDGDLTELAAPDGPDDAVAASARHLGLAWAQADAQVLLTRVGGGDRRAVEVRVGPAGVVALPVAPHDEAVDVALAPPTALAATLWRLLRLGPRRHHGRAVTGLDVASLTAPFDASDAPADDWRVDLGLDPQRAVLSRVEVRVAPGEPPVPLGLVDDGQVLATVTSDDGQRFDVTITTAGELLRTLAGWQERLLVAAGLDDPELDAARREEPRTHRRLAVPGGTLDVAVPEEWAPVSPPVGLLAAWRAPEATSFAVNVTVSDVAPAATPYEVAAGLPHGRWVEAPAPDVAVLLHRAPTTDVVTVQRDVPVEGGSVAVSWTCAAHQARTWLPELIAWANETTMRREVR